MELPRTFFDNFARLDTAARSELARAWITRALVLIAPLHPDGAHLRSLALRQDKEAALDELADLVQQRTEWEGPTYRVLDRLLAMIGAWRRGQHARIGELLLQVAEAADELTGVDPGESLGATSSTSSVAISIEVDVPARFQSEVREQMVANVQARLNR